MNKFDLLQIQHAYKTKGLVYAIQLACGLLYISTMVWAYKNIWLARYIINKRIAKQSPYLKLVLHLFMYSFDDPNYFNKLIWSLPKECQKSYAKMLIKQNKYGKDKNNTV